MSELTTRTPATNPTTGLFHVILPDALSPTGYTSYKISYTNLVALLDGRITTNEANISTNTSNITTLEGINSRSKHVDQVTDFTFSQPEDSRITSIVIKSANNATFLIGTTLGGSELYAGTLTSEYGRIAKIEKPISEFYTATPRTIYFTITGAASPVSATIYYTKDEF